MSAADRIASLLRLVDRMTEGNLAHLLSIPEFDAPLHMGRSKFLVDRLRPFLEDPDATPNDPELRRLDRDNVALLAQRFLLGRDVDGLERLALLWQANGTPADVICAAAEAVRAADDWPGQIDAYSPAHACFVQAMGIIERDDPSGPLGRAVQLSRYHGAGDCRRPWPHLAGETQHTGFPVLLGADAAKEPSFREAAWVWLGELDDLTNRHVPDCHRPRGHRNSSPDEPLERERTTRQRWRRLCSYILTAGQGDKPPTPSLPNWFLLAAARFGVESFQSAGLALALNWLACDQGRPLPAGIGFTACLEPAGRPEDARLRAVTGIAAKLRAAREAGIFALFACFDPVREPVADMLGVTLVPLPEVSVGEAIRLINTACANLGLTEYRWEWANHRQRDSLHLLPGEASIESRPLPDAAQESEESLPVGFVGRQHDLKELDRWLAGSQGRLRLRCQMIGEPRAGKTTLLGHWLQSVKQRSRFPVWFSFLRGRQGALTAEDLQAALREQIRARFCVLLRPARDDGRRDDLLRFLGDHVQADVDVVVDGLDEASPGQRRQAVEYLESLGGNGLLVLASQRVAELPGPGWSSHPMRRGPEPDPSDAIELVRRFAERFSRSPHLQTQANQLRQTKWQEGLARQAAGNLWMLTNFLLLVEHDRAGFPEDPSATILAPDVEQYCRRLLDEVVRSCPTSADGAELAQLLVGLAILEDRCWPAFPQEDRWPLDGVLRLLGLGGPTASWERLLSDHASQLVTLSRQHVRFRDGTVRQALKRSGEQLALAQRLVERMRLSPTGQGDLFEQRYAVSNVARHLTGEVELPAPEAAALACTLIFETPWASQRLRSVAVADQPVNEMLHELEELRSLVERRPAPSEALKALRTLQDALAVWGGAIDQSRACVGRWWTALSALRPFPCWSIQVSAEMTEGPVLLLPENGDGEPGYPLPQAPPLTGLACELLDARATPGTLVCAAEHGFLVLYRYAAETRVFTLNGLVGLGVKEVRGLVALDEKVVAVLAHDWAQEPRLLQVDVRSGVVTELENPAGGDLVGIASLASAAPDQPRRLLVASWVREHTRIAILENGEDSGIPHAELPFRATGLLAFAPTAWAVHHVCSGRRLLKPEEAEKTSEESAEQEVDEGTSGDAEESIPDWDQFVIQRMEGRGIIDVEWEGRERFQYLWIGRLSQGPGEQLFVQFYDSKTTGGILYASDGTHKWATGKISLKSHEPSPDYGGGISLAWSNLFGLLITNDVAGINALPLGSEALPCYLPEELEARIPGADGSGGLPCGGLRLSDGRSLLLYDFGGVILEPDGRSVVHIDNPETSRKLEQIIGAKEDGSLIFGVPSRSSPYALDSLLEDPEELLPSREPAPLRDRGFVRTASDGSRFQIQDAQVRRPEGKGWVRLWDLSNLFSRQRNPDNALGNFYDQIWGDAEWFLGLADPEWPHLLDLARQDGNFWRLRVAFGSRCELNSILFICEVNLDANTYQWSLLGEPLQINLGQDRVTACAVIGPDSLAIGYGTGRIEIISATPEQEGNRQVRAIGFTVAAPTSMAVVRRPQGMSLAVSAGSVAWFKLPAADGV